MIAEQAMAVRGASGMMRYARAAVDCELVPLSRA